MIQCIICRQYYDDINGKLSDEHVIPDSLGGYYHIYNVCDQCNKNMGTIIDTKLVSHKIMELSRFLNNIKSRSNYLPNPFGGTWNAKDADGNDLKVQVFLNESGDIDYKLIPSGIKKVGENQYQLIIDKRDEGTVDKILDRFCRKSGIDKKLIKVEKNSESTRPCIECHWEIDTVKFKIGLLKIAYEFAIDILPHYRNDCESLVIANVLRTGKLNALDHRTRFIGNGVNEKAVQCMRFMRNLDNKHHHIMLISVENVGLQCYINLFNTMFIGVWLSNNYYKIPGDIFIGINDIENKKFIKMNIAQYCKENYTKPKLKLYTNQNQEITDYFILPNGCVPLFYKSGKLAAKDISALPKKNVKIKDLGDMKEMIETKVMLKKEIYYFRDKDDKMHLLKFYTVQQSKLTDLFHNDVTT